MNEELFTPEQMKPADDKIITTVKCPVCGELATVYKFGKGQGRISHHGHSVCFSSREVRALIAPGTGNREPEGAHQVEPGTVNREPEDAHQVAPGTEPETGNREPGDETLTFGVF